MGTKHPALHSSTFFTDAAHWIHEKPIQLTQKEIYTCEFKFQHTHDLVDCEICETPKGLIVKLMKTKRALTPGQYAVFYKGDECIGSARIVYSGPSNFLLYYLQNRSYEKLPGKRLKLASKLNKSIKRCENQNNQIKQISL